MHYQHTLKFASKSYFHNFLLRFRHSFAVSIFYDRCKSARTRTVLSPITSFFLLLSRPVLLLTVASKSACVGLSVSHGRECLLQPASG